MPRFNFNRALLLSSTTFVGGIILSTMDAHAECVPNFVNSFNQIVNCVGPSTGVSNDGNADTTTVNVQDGAVVDGGGQRVIDLLQGSTVNMFGNSQVKTTNSYGIYINGDNATVTLNDFAQVSTTNLGAIYASGNNAIITLNDNASVSASGGGYGIIITGGAVTLNDNSKISNAFEGIASFGTSVAITLNGNSQITAYGEGIRLSNSGNNVVTMNDNSRIIGAGLNSTGIQVLFSGDGSVVAINKNAVIENVSRGVQFGFGSNTLINHGTIIATDVGFLGDEAVFNSDIVENYGTIISNGVAIDLRQGDDSLTLGTGSNIIGSIEAFDGTDLVTFVGSGSEDNLFLNFENAVMNGVDWSLSGNSTFSNQVQINQGRLAIDGVITATNGTNIFAPGILGGTGTFNSNIGSAGTIAPGNGVGALNIVGNVTQAGQFGGGFEIEFDNSDLDLLNITGQLGLQNRPSVNVMPLDGAGGAEGIFVQTTAGINGQLGAITYQGNGSAAVFQDGNDLRLIAFDGTGTVAGNAAGLRGAMDYLDAVVGAQLYDDTRDDRREARVWGRGFGHFTAEDTRDGNQAYNTRTAGSAVGGDFEVLEGLRLGLSGGYGSTDAEVARNAANAEIDGEYAALYARYELGGIFVSGVMSGGLQQVDFDRSVATRNGRQEAEGETDALVYGGSLHAGYDFDFGEGFRLTPSAGVLYQHQRVDGYKESGTGRGDVTMKDQESDAIRLTGQVNLAKTIDFEGFELTPRVSAGIANEITKGGKARGTFSNGTEFEVQLQEDNQVMGLAGAGLSIGFDTGLALSLDYQGRIAGETTDHGIIAGVAFKW